MGALPNVMCMSIGGIVVCAGAGASCLERRSSECWEDVSVTFILESFHTRTIRGSGKAYLSSAGGEGKVLRVYSVPGAIPL
jgi:hypothetical protein